MGIPAERIEGCGKEALQCQATLQLPERRKGSLNQYRKGLPIQNKGDMGINGSYCWDLEIIQRNSLSEDSCFCWPPLFFALIYLFTFWYWIS